MDALVLLAEALHPTLIACHLAIQARTWIDLHLSSSASEMLFADFVTTFVVGPLTGLLGVLPSRMKRAFNKTRKGWQLTWSELGSCSFESDD